MDPENKIVKLCAEGMRAEAHGDTELARKLFYQAWKASSDNYEACIAAHYVARHQDNPQATLDWNREALDRANAARHDHPEAEAEIIGFMPSLYLNMGWSYEICGQLDEAMRYYQEARKHLDVLELGPYRDVVAEGVKKGMLRIDNMRYQLL